MSKLDYGSYAIFAILAVASGVLLTTSSAEYALVLIVVMVLITGIYTVRTRHYFGSIRSRQLENLKYSKAVHADGPQLLRAFETKGNQILDRINARASVSASELDDRLGVLEKSLRASTLASTTSASRQIRDLVVLERKRLIAELEKNKNEGQLDDRVQIENLLVQIRESFHAQKNVALDSLVSNMDRIHNEQSLSIEMVSRRIRNQVVAAQNLVVDRVHSDVNTVIEEIERAQLQISSAQIAHIKKTLSSIDAFRSSVDKSAEKLHLLVDFRENLEAASPDAQVSSSISKACNGSESLDNASLTNDEGQGSELELLLRNTENIQATLNNGIEMAAAQRLRETTKLTKIIWEETREVGAHAQLLPRITPRWAMPPLGRWALDAKSMLHLALLIEEREPKVIVELGSGSSTIWLSYFAEEYGASVRSFDHLNKFKNQTTDYIHKHKLEETAFVSLAELKPYRIDGRDYSWYDVNALDGIDSIDLLIVDGPPGGTGPWARYPAIPLLQHKLSADCLVLLDDSDREHEAEVLEQWMEQYPHVRQLDVGVSRLAVLDGFGVKIDNANVHL